MVIIINIKRILQKLIRRTDRTELARRGGGWVGKVAARRGDVRVHVLFACHARRWVEGRELDGGAVDLKTTDC